MCSYFFDRPDDEAPEDNRLAAGAGASRSAASQSFHGHLPAVRQQPKGEPALQLSLA